MPSRQSSRLHRSKSYLRAMREAKAEYQRWLVAEEKRRNGGRPSRKSSSLGSGAECWTGR